MPGWFGYSASGGETTPLDEAYSRVTNPERFRPLHSTMLEILDRLESQFEAVRTEGHGLDEELTRGVDVARPDVRLTPRDPKAAPIVVSFTAFPGVFVRFGRWYIEPFPSCGCDHCDESAEDEIERLNDMVDDVTAGRFREVVKAPAMFFIGRGWVETKFWSPEDGRGSRRREHGSLVDGRRAREMTGGRRRLELNWKPWQRRRSVG